MDCKSVYLVQSAGTVNEIGERPPALTNQKNALCTILPTRQGGKYSSLAQSGSHHRGRSSVPARPPIVVVAPLLPASKVAHDVLSLHIDDARVRVGIGEDVDRIVCLEKWASGSNCNALQVAIEPVEIGSL